MKNKDFKVLKLVVVFLVVGFFSDKFYGSSPMVQANTPGSLNTTTRNQITSNINGLTAKQVNDAVVVINDAIKEAKESNSGTGLAAGATLTFQENDSHAQYVWSVTVTKNTDGSYSTFATETNQTSTFEW